MHAPPVNSDLGILCNGLYFFPPPWLLGSVEIPTKFPDDSWGYDALPYYPQPSPPCPTAIGFGDLRERGLEPIPYLRS